MVEASCVLHIALYIVMVPSNNRSVSFGLNVGVSYYSDVKYHCVSCGAFFFVYTRLEVGLGHKFVASLFAFGHFGCFLLNFTNGISKFQHSILSAI